MVILRVVVKYSVHIAIQNTTNLLDLMQGACVSADTHTQRERERGKILHESVLPALLPAILAAVVIVVVVVVVVPACTESYV